jgi:hypothetical protein
MIERGTARGVVFFAHLPSVGEVRRRTPGYPVWYARVHERRQGTVYPDTLPSTVRNANGKIRLYGRDDGA